MTTMKTTVSVFCLLMAAGVIALPNVLQYEIKGDENESVPMLTLTEAMTVRKPSLRVTDFMFKDCGGPMSMVTISSVEVTPDPLSFPGPLSVAAMFKINKAVDSPLTGDVVIEKKVLGKYIKIPCVDNFGSCTYDNLCQLLEQVQCPDPIVKIGINCRCPIPMNSYTFPKTEFDVDVNLPLPTGDYHVVGNVTSNGNIAVCIDLTLTYQ